MKGFNWLIIKLLLIFGLSLNLFGAYNAGVVKREFAAGSLKINADLNQFFTDNPDIKVIWTYKDGEYQAISSDVDIQNDLDDQSIPMVQTIESSDGFFVK